MKETEWGEREGRKTDKGRERENPSKPQYVVNGPQAGHELTCDLERIVG